MVYKRTTAPAVTDDISGGFRSGDVWIDVTTRRRYVCTSNAVRGAVWSAAASGSLQLDGVVALQGELAVGAAAALLVSTSFPCKRIWFGAPLSVHAGGVNVGTLLIGAGTVRLTFTNQPGDGEILVLADGTGASTTFEFDSNSTYTVSRTQVVIGASTAASITALAAAINADTTLRTFAVATATTLLLTYASAATVTSGGGTWSAGAVNAVGGIPLVSANTQGFYYPVVDASWVYVAGTDASDVVEYQIFTDF
jgi:hypothetical protein